jgi:hypothetical protein
LALAAGRTGKTPPQTSTIASKPAPYHQGEALSAARCVGQFLTYQPLLRKFLKIPKKTSDINKRLRECIIFIFFHEIVKV